ncbi:MAG: hypothetical protein L0212_10740, partial [Acidobacteria bacterium]|nr:hypothetical protein [Acidobacteriota bacterium]
MRIPTWKVFLRSGTTALLVASLTLWAPVVAQQVKQTPQGKQWEAKYEEGTENIPQQAKLQVTVGTEKIVIDKDRQHLLDIAPASVIEVSYDTKVRRRLAESAAIAALSLGAAAVFAALKTKKHFVNILWEDSGAKKEVVLKVGKGEYASLLAELQRVTGKEWRNLEMEAKQAEEELNLEKKNKVGVQLDRSVQVGDKTLAAGLYQVVLLSRPENKGELYFFAGKEVNTKKIAAAAWGVAGVVLGAAYLLWLYQRVFFGPVNNP